MAPRDLEGSDEKVHNIQASSKEIIPDIMPGGSGFAGAFDAVGFRS